MQCKTLQYSLLKTRNDVKQIEFKDENKPELRIPILYFHGPVKFNQYS